MPGDPAGDAAVLAASQEADQRTDGDRTEVLPVRREGQKNVHVPPQRCRERLGGEHGPRMVVRAPVP